MRNRILKLAAGLMVLFATFGFGNYLLDAHKRITRGPLCDWEEVPNPDNFPYNGRWCKLTKDTALLQLHDGRSRTMVAERMFFELDRPIFFGDSHRLGYDSRGDGSVIQLPPTLIDRIRAKMP